jgi:hypothetical protein
LPALSYSTTRAFETPTHDVPYRQTPSSMASGLPWMRRTISTLEPIV